MAVILANDHTATARLTGGNWHLLRKTNKGISGTNDIFTLTICPIFANDIGYETSMKPLLSWF